MKLNIIIIIIIIKYNWIINFEIFVKLNPVVETIC